VTLTVPPQLSDVVTRAVLGAGTSLAHWTVIFAGQVIVGAVLSNTVITCAQVAELPHASVALYVRVNVNLLTHVMLVITSLTWVTVDVPAQLSVTVTCAIFGAGTCDAHWNVRLAGQVTIGGVSSNTLMICAQVAELPQASVAL
jgi:hypothetical protein